MSHYTVKEKESDRKRELIRKFENEIAKEMNVIRKISTGRGASQTVLKISKDSIYLEFASEYTPIEAGLMRFLDSEDITHKYYRYIKPKMIKVNNDYYTQIHPDLEVKDMIINIDSDKTFVIIRFHRSIEEMIFSGEIKLPLTAKVVATRL